MMEAKHSRQSISTVKEHATISHSRIENDTINLVQRMILYHNLAKRMILSHNLRNLSELFFYILYVEEHQMRGQNLRLSKCNYIFDQRRIRGRLKKNEQMPKGERRKYLVFGLDQEQEVKYKEMSRDRTINTTAEHSP